MSLHFVKKPCLPLIVDMENPRSAKTAFGLRDWTREACVAQLRFNDKAVDLGLVLFGIWRRSAPVAVHGPLPVSNL
jgi:hypothetical protein